MKPFKLAISLVLVAAVLACSPGEDDSDPIAPVETASSATIAEVIAADESFATLAGAMNAAEPADALSREGSITIFAPVNEAFADLDAGDPDLRSAILRRHVIEGALDAGTLIEAIENAGEGGYAISTLGGGELIASRDDGAVILTDNAGGTSTIIATDIQASNGLIHAVDAVLIGQ